MARYTRDELLFQPKHRRGELQHYVATLANGKSYRIKRQEGGRRAKWALFIPGTKKAIWLAATLGDAKALANCEYHITQREAEFTCVDVQTSRRWTTPSKKGESR